MRLLNTMSVFLLFLLAILPCNLTHAQGVLDCGWGSELFDADGPIDSDEDMPGIENTSFVKFMSNSYVNLVSDGCKCKVDINLISVWSNCDGSRVDDDAGYRGQLIVSGIQYGPGLMDARELPLHKNTISQSTQSQSAILPFTLPIMLLTGNLEITCGADIDLWARADYRYRRMDREYPLDIPFGSIAEADLPREVNDDCGGEVEVLHFGAKCDYDCVEPYYVPDTITFGVTSTP